MQENKYDEQTFFDKYSQMTRSVKGLEGAGEWHTLEKMLPDFQGKRVVDLGCGFGWHCQYAIEHGAASVTGVDLSQNMLAVARQKTDPAITYLHASIEAVDFPQATVDVVLSSLAFHYLPSFTPIASKVAGWLVSGGAFVFSVEHPIFTAQGTQDWYYDADGTPLHYPVDHYFAEGQREAVFLGEKVVKYHKTLTTYISTLLQQDFEITGVIEPQPPANMLADNAWMQNELRRPMMLLISARKK